ncbi:YncE family protein [Nocardioides bizhenqiangii]|uniref:Serine/threonine protein kinase n=1 Tax=Nocardioides bizhenqiangii TaxID=3095076 RepID=A0ABZ0ZP73_9ACTN|nr:MULTISPECIES: serine/threonine protein kinase [unclassified Nocardioides]MDZ5621589.1 serine/threonine protein kinase [Nocardioides sp. HM23]WQQ25574.1 serine/threonine protein kinase [Nocardioides sp. HM61]
MPSLTRLLVTASCGAAALAAFVVPTPSAPAEPTTASASTPADLAPAPGFRAAAPAGLRDVMWVGNNWDGTASIVDAHSFKVLKRGVNLIPDKSQELNAIFTNPVKLALFLAIRVGPGEGHDQYVDDMFTTPDGRYLAVSRPSFADVVWIDIRRATLGLPDPIVREQQMDGFRTDHMGLSPDGLRLLVSDSTSRQVIEYAMVDQPLADGTEAEMGDRLRTFPSGETPHESNYTKSGGRIFHASIGRVYTPGDGTEALDDLFDPLTDPVKGDRWFQIVRSRNFKILKRWEIGHELEEAGFPHMSSAVRPMAIAPGSRYVYFQVSFFHGYVKFDTQAPDLNGTTDYTLQGLPEPTTGRVLGIVNLQNRVPTMPRDLYVNDSAHHGLSINRQGTKLCVAGTMDDYAALVDVGTGKATYYDEATTGHDYGKPYWTTEGLGDTCWISLSESDSVAVLDTNTGEELAFRAVGNHPQRVRHGYVREALASQW